MTLHHADRKSVKNPVTSRLVTPMRSPIPVDASEFGAAERPS
jgi:hypothetical protein